MSSVLPYRFNFFLIVQADQLFEPTITNPLDKMYWSSVGKAVKVAVSK
jgi:hypothetical protein